MNTPEHLTSPPERVSLKERSTLRGRLAQALAFIAVIGGTVILIAGAILFVVDWFSGYHLIRLWQQVCAFFGGAVLLAAALLISSLRRVSQFLIGITGLLLLLAFCDSLDDKQQFLPTVSLLLWFWAAIYTYTVAEVQQAKHLSTSRLRLTISLGLVVSLIYLSAALYYVVINRTVSIVSINSHPLYAFGIVFATVLRFLGDIPPYNHRIRGEVWICSNCGLRNIVERSTCKRCGYVRAIEVVK